VAGLYVPRSPTTGVLYGVVRGNWSDFAATARERSDRVGLPSFRRRSQRCPDYGPLQLLDGTGAGILAAPRRRICQRRRAGRKESAFASSNT